MSSVPFHSIVPLSNGERSDIQNRLASGGTTQQNELLYNKMLQLEQTVIDLQYRIQVLENMISHGAAAGQTPQSSLSAGGQTPGFVQGPAADRKVSGTDGQSSGNTVNINDAEYLILGSSVQLLKYLGNTQNIEVPGFVMDKPVTSIAAHAFERTPVQHVSLPDSILVIEEECFMGCQLLESVRLPSGIQSLNSGTFAGCVHLRSITMPENLINIGDNVFEGCTSLSDIALPPQLSSIGQAAFKDCILLMNVTLPPTVKNIGPQAFFGCRLVKTVRLPEIITSISAESFKNCSGLKQVIMTNNILSINESAFEGCSSLEMINMSNQLVTIGKTAFAGCANLKDIALSNTVTNFGKDIFKGCSELTIHTYKGAAAVRYAKDIRYRIKLAYI